MTTSHGTDVRSAWPLAYLPELPVTAPVDAPAPIRLSSACRILSQPQASPSSTLTPRPERVPAPPMTVRPAATARTRLYRDGKLSISGFPAADISEYADQPGVTIWLDLHNPDRDDLAVLREEFGLHPLAVKETAPCPVALDGRRPGRRVERWVPGFPTTPARRRLSGVRKSCYWAPTGWFCRP